MTLSKMKATIITGQYGVGKTTTINKLLPSISEKYKVGVFVAESASIAPDTARFATENAGGASFAAICCPTLSDISQAIETALDGRNYEYLLVEPPGNLDPRLAIDALTQRQISIEHVLMLASHPHHQADKNMPTFNAAKTVANIVGITRAKLNIEDMISEFKGKPVIKIGDNFTYSDMIQHKSWDSINYVPLPEDAHSDHYKRTLRLIDQNYSKDEIIDFLKGIAADGLPRAKGTLLTDDGPFIFDIKDTELNVVPHPNPKNAGSISYIAAFANDEFTPLQNKIFDKIADSERTPAQNLETNELVTSFRRLYDQCSGIVTSVEGKVLWSFQPVDPAYKIAGEYFARTGDSELLRMILVPRTRTRLKALKELDASNQADKAITGLMLSAYLSQTLTIDKGRDFPKLMDQYLLRLVKERAPNKLFQYATQTQVSDIERFPNWENREGPYIVEMASRVKGFAQSEFFDTGKENMIKLHKQIGYDKLADRWNTI